MKSTAISILISAMLVSGCIVTTGPRAGGASTTSSPPSSTFTPSLGIAQTTSAPGSTATIPSQGSGTLTTDCLAVSSTAPPKSSRDGIIVLENRAEGKGGQYAPGIFLLDAATWQLGLVSKEGKSLSNFVVAPDGSLIAYQQHHLQENRTELVISDSNLEEQKALPWQDAWSSILGWTADKAQLLIRESSDAGKLPGIIVLDVKTGATQVIGANYPNLYEFNPPDWDGWPLQMYDPTVSHLVYMRSGDQTGLYSYALWDLAAQKMVVDPRIVLYPIPRWSPDGSRLITTGLIDKDPWELYAIGTQGEMNQLTNLSKYARDMAIADYSWSPDGQHIALWLYPRSDIDRHKLRLAVLDTRSAALIDYCVDVNAGGKGYGGIPAPIWSPNGQQLLLLDWYSPDHRRIILVDPVEHFAGVVAQDAEPAGWMSNP